MCQPPAKRLFGYSKHASKDHFGCSQDCSQNRVAYSTPVAMIKYAEMLLQEVILRNHATVLNGDFRSGFKLHNFKLAVSHNCCFCSSRDLQYSSANVASHSPSFELISESYCRGMCVNFSLEFLFVCVCVWQYVS